MIEGHMFLCRFVYILWILRSPYIGNSEPFLCPSTPKGYDAKLSRSYFPVSNSDS